MPKCLQLELRTFKKTRLSIQRRNIQQLLIQICKCLKGLSLPTMSEILVLRNIPYPLRNLRDLDSQLQMNVHRGLEITTCKGCQFWHSYLKYSSLVRWGWFGISSCETTLNAHAKLAKRTLKDWDSYKKNHGEEIPIYFFIIIIFCQCK